MPGYVEPRSRLNSTQKRIVALMALSAFINYVDRGNLSLAAPLLKDEIGISAAQLGILLSAFFWTYTGLQAITGWIVDRFDVGWVLGAGFLIWSVATAATGVVHGFAALLVLRLMLGVGESVAFPSYSKIIAKVIPPEKRGLANSWIIAGLQSGPGVGTLFGGLLMAQFGWRPFFIATGAISLLWIVPWIGARPTATFEGTYVQTVVPRTLEILRQRSAWGSIVGQFGGNYILYFMITWLPFYLVREQHFTMGGMAKLAGTGYLIAAGVAIACGWASDKLISHGMSATSARKSFAAGGLLICAVLLGAGAFAGPRATAVLVVLITCANAMAGSNLYAIAQTLAGPNAAGRWVGIQNCLANLSGVLAPALTGFVVERTGHFYYAFGAAALFALVGAFCWAFVVGPVEQIEWEPSEAKATAAV